MNLDILMESTEKESYVAPAMLIVEVNVGRALLLGSDLEGQGNGFEGWD